MIRWRQEQQNLVVDFDTGPVQLSDPQREPLEHAAARIRKRCHDMSGPVLHIRVSKDDRDDEYEVEMSLNVMRRSLRGIGKAQDLADAVDYARDKILSQMGPFKAVLRREEIYRLQHHLGAAEPIEATAPSSSSDSPEIKEFEKDLEAYWRPLVRQVSREISALEMHHRLPLGELAAQDIVDEVIVRAFERFGQRPADVPLEIWLYREARQVLAERREQLQQESPMSSIPPQRSMKQALPPPPLPNPQTDAEDVLMDLLEPEPEIFPGEDLADSAPTLPRTEMQQALRRVISHLPAAQREAVWLHYLDGFDIGEIAAVQDRPEQDVRSDLEQAVSRLRDAIHSWRSWHGESPDQGPYHRQPPPERT